MTSMIEQATTLARRGLHPTTILNVAAPVATYQLLTAYGATASAALLVSAAFPTATVLARVVRTRKLDAMGALSLAALLLGAAGAFLFNNPRFLLVKDSAVTGLFGLAFLGSLLIDRPLLLVLARAFADGQAMSARQQAQLKTAAPARLRHMTLVWGLALLGEATTRVILSFLLAPTLVLTISPLLTLAAFGPLTLWSWRVRTATQARAAKAA